MSGINFNDSSSKALISPVDLTTQVTGVLPVANGGSGTGTALTAGSIVFAGVAGVLSQDHAQLFWNDSLNRFGFGTATPAYPFNIVGSGATGNILMLESYSADTLAPMLFKRARGTYAAPTATQTNDMIAGFLGAGYGTTAFGANTGSFTVRADAAFTDASQPTHMQFSTTPSGSTVRVERMRIDPSGNVGIGATVPATRLHVVPTGAAAVGSTFQGAAAQTGDLTQWQNSAATVLASVGSGGTFTIPVGAAATPSMTFIGDTDTGMYSSGANSIGFACAGGARFIINNSNISPQVAILHASAGAAATPVYSQASSTSSGMFFAGGATASLTGGGVEQIRVSASETTLQNGLKIKRTTSAAGAYTALVTDHYIGKTGITGGGDTINLPAAATAGVGKIFVIKDEAGTAGTDNITIDPSGAETVDGAATFPINTNYGSAKLICSGTAWFVI